MTEEPIDASPAAPVAEAWAALRAGPRRLVPEREVLRVSALLAADGPEDPLLPARHAVLAWAERRCGGNLPQRAWRGDGFEYIASGRTTLGARLETEQVDIWALRGDDPDKGVAQRTWTTEVVLGRQTGAAAHLGLRLLVASPEEEPDFEPAVPGLLRQIAKQPGLLADGRQLSAAPWRITSDADLARLIALLESPTRRLPVFLASGDERAADPDQPMIDVAMLARTMLGLAHVVVVPARLTYGLSDAFGRLRSCYHGAVRAYLPGFDSAADPYRHPLILPETHQRDPAGTLAGLRRLAAKESLRRLRLGADVLAFAAVRRAALEFAQAAAAPSRSGTAEQLEDARQRIAALQAELDQKQAEAEQYFTLAQQEEERAQAAEAQLHHARQRIAQLEAMLAARGEPAAEEELPKAWEELADWCDRMLIGRLVLAPAARRGIKKALFRDHRLAARCLAWLAGECRNRRLRGGGAVANLPLLPGIENAPCGADSFRFDFQGRSLTADWHIKNGGNTREPRRCLRIYYAWDEATQQIVVAEMPAHRRTGAS
ncbi:MAG: hypothetical protein NZN45_04030 [Rhodovarius sp.]|nr:hypothetical protein [Rhodovarius sp.]